MLLRSSPHSQRRLSDLMVGGDVGDVNVGLEDQLEDLLGPDPADMDRNPHGEPFGQRTGTAGKPRNTLLQGSVFAHMAAR